MKKIAFVFMAGLAVLAFTGCKKKGDDATAKMEGFKNEMCACKDKACAEAVNKKMTDWANAQPKKEGDKAKSDPKAEAVGKAYGECMTKLMMADMGAPPAGGAPAGDQAPAGGAPPAGDMKKDDTAAPPAGDMKKDDMKKDDMKKDEPKK
jgi:hypothetical protein